MPSDKQEIYINIGGLEGIASVYKHTSKGLQEFNDCWKRGEQSIIHWDIRSLRDKEMNIAAISFFLAIAHRVRHFVGYPQPVLIDWNPNIFGFLSDIGFFKIANSYDLFKWPYEIGGHEVGKTNPNTKLLAYNQLSQLPDISDANQLSEWKKRHRENYRADIIDKCESLFIQKDQQKLGENLALVMSRTCAEIAINSLLWGKSAAFLGIQRSGKRITISISDIGVGFKSSLFSKNVYLNLLNNDNADITSIALCSVINENGFGLKRAISTVIKLGGSISIASNAGEIFWRENIWNEFIGYFDANGAEYSISKLPETIYKAEHCDRDNGYIRKWSNPIRGSRVSFSIPINL
ncbi:MAG: hypothetical protein NTW85_12210 [Methylococcales bacterium]|nr:hypothetical protein [Methylococcales bacterium]